MKNAHILGVGMTKIGRLYEKGYKELALEAIDKALRDSEIEASDIDYLVVSSLFSAEILHQLDIGTMLSNELGIKTRAVRVEAGESSGSAALEYASLLIQNNVAKNVLVVGVEKMSEYPSSKINSVYTHLLDYEYEAVRNIAPVNYVALIMKAYMKRYGVERREILKWAVKMHENARKNPYAYLNFSINLEDALKSQVISDPVTIYDAFPICDGAAALLLSSEKDQTVKRPVKILNIFSSTSEPLYLRDEILSLPSTRKAVNSLKKKLNLKITKNVALQVHDSFTIYGILILEELGLAEKGKGAEVIDEMPYLNFGGGLKARGHPIGASPLYAVAEIVKLLRHEFPGVTYEGDIGVIHTMSGPDNNSWLIVLKGD